MRPASSASTFPTIVKACSGFGTSSIMMRTLSMELLETVIVARLLTVFRRSTSDDGATSPTGGLDDGGDRRRLLENLLVLEEFCKELAATLQAFFIIHYYEPQPQEFSTRSPSPSLPGGHVPGKGH
jgi:hypothetical protein